MIIDKINLDRKIEQYKNPTSKLESIILVTGSATSLISLHPSIFQSIRRLVMSVFGFQLPHVFVGATRTIIADLFEDFLQIRY